MFALTLQITGASHGASLAVDIALSCLQHAAAGLPDEGEHVKMVAALIFPFIMIILKVTLKSFSCFLLVTELSSLAFSLSYSFLMFNTDPKIKSESS